MIGGLVGGLSGLFLLICMILLLVVLVLICWMRHKKKMEKMDGKVEVELAEFKLRGGQTASMVYYYEKDEDYEKPEKQITI